MPEPIDLKFHEIVDIRRVYDVDPALTFWVVDFTVGPGLLPQSIPYLDLSEAAMTEVMHAYLDGFLGDDCPRLSDYDVHIPLDVFFRNYPEITGDIPF